MIHYRLRIGFLSVFLKIFSVYFTVCLLNFDIVKHVDCSFVTFSKLAVQGSLLIIKISLINKITASKLSLSSLTIGRVDDSQKSFSLLAAK